MTQPANTFDTYDSVGIREDLADVIYNVDPSETPFYSKSAKTKAKNTLVEWQTQALRASAVNAHIEGDATSADAVTPTVRLGARTQIFKNAVVISDTDEAVDNAGRAARKTGGVPSWLITNVNFQSGNSGANPTGDGTNARTDDGTPTAFSQAKFDDVMQSIWEEGGKPDTVYLSAFQMNVALGFTGNNNQRSAVQAGDETVVKSLAVYVTPWGTVQFMPSRENRSRDVFILQDNMWECAVLRGTKNVALAKNGDNTTRQVTTELALCSKNEKANGAIYDNTTS
jgi:hypothetical protein